MKSFSHVYYCNTWVPTRICTLPSISTYCFRSESKTINEIKKKLGQNHLLTEPVRCRYSPPPPCRYHILLIFDENL